MTSENAAPAEMPGEIERAFNLAARAMQRRFSASGGEEDIEAALSEFFAPILAEKEREIERMKQTRLLLDRRIHCQRMSNRANWMIVEQRSFWMRRAAQYFVRRGKARLEARALAAEAALAAERERFESMVRAYEARSLEEERNRLEAAAPLSVRETARYLEVERKLAALNAAAIRAEGE